MCLAERSGVGLNALLGLRLRPHGQLIAAGLGEVEPAATREGEDRLDYFAASGFDPAERAFKVFAVENDESASGFGTGRQVRPEEAAV